MKARILMLALTLTLATSCDRTPPVTNPNPFEENGRIKLRSEKSIAEDYVLRAKQFPDASKQERARILYAAATARHNAYVDGLLSCIRRGRKADLTPSANDASAAAATFKKFVDDNSMTKGIDWLTPGVSLVKAALELIVSVRTWNVVERNKFADELALQIRWKKWVEIKD